MFDNSMVYLANALKVIKEVNNGEWEPESFHGGCLYIIERKDGKKIWVANGPWFCDGRNGDKYFGFLFRHLVWWGAIKWYKAKVEYTEAVRL